MSALSLLLAVLVATIVAPAAAPAAATRWTRPQEVLPQRCCANPVAVASNARGDAVAVFGGFNSLSIARSTAHRRFGRRVPIKSRGYAGAATVAIDERGVALAAFTFDDRSDPGYFEGRGEDSCCTGVKVVVWRPGHRPTAPRAIFATGTTTLLGGIAATRSRRGVLVVGQRGAALYANARTAPVQLAPVRLDGRIGKLRTVADRSWTPRTLQWHRGRAVAGLMRTVGGQGLDLGAARQGRRGAFRAARRFARIGRIVQDQSLGAVEMTADGRGGHVAVWRRVTKSGLQLVLGRASGGGRLRSTVLARGASTHFTFAAPAVARDGWIVVAWSQIEDATRSTYVTSRSPRGRLVTSRILGPTPGVTIERRVESLAAAAAPGGAGAVAVDFDAPPLWGTRIVGLRGGHPLPGAVLDIESDALTYRTVVTANARERGRALFRVNGRNDITQLRVLESRLR